MTQGLSSPERNSKILWINLEFLKAFCVYRNSRIPYRDPHRYPPRGLRDDIVRNSRISRLNLEFLNLEFLEAFCVYRNSRIPKACVILSCVFSFSIDIVRRGRTMTQGLSSPDLIGGCHHKIEIPKGAWR